MLSEQVCSFPCAILHHVTFFPSFFYIQLFLRGSCRQVRTAVCTSSPTGLPPDYLSNLHLHPQCFSMVYSFLFMPKSNSHTHWLLYAQLYCQFSVCVKKRLHELRPEKLYYDAKYFNGARRISFVLCSMHSAFLSDCNHL